MGKTLTITAKQTGEEGAFKLDNLSLGSLFTYRGEVFIVTDMIIDRSNTAVPVFNLSIDSSELLHRDTLVTCYNVVLANTL